MMAKKPKTPDALIGRPVIVNADAIHLSGNPHEWAGMQGVVIDRTQHGSYQLNMEDGQAAIVLPLDSFTVLPLADLATVTVTVDTSAQPPAQANPVDAPASSPPLDHSAELLVMDTALIVASRTNPRSRFDAEFLQELAVSIKLQGVLQPILVRPLPASRVEETSWGTGSEALRRKAVRPTHEIVAGEQRFRACEIAGVKRIPALIRHLTDSQVLELQLVENLKRRDLHPMEEAEGYERLMTQAGYTADQVAERIGKSRSYVYKSTKLLELSSDSRQAFYAGKLTASTALLVARHVEALQAEIIADISKPAWNGDVMSYREALAYIHSHYMLQLNEAPFPIADATLVVGVGSCKDCPKRTGAAPDLFADVKAADTCTDKDCFASKRDAHHDKIKDQARAKGQKVVVGKEAKAILPNNYGEAKGYKKLDAPIYQDGKTTSLRKLLGKNIPDVTLVESPHTKELVAMVPTAIANKLLKERGMDGGRTPEQNAESKKQKAVERYQNTWRKRAVQALYEDALSHAESRTEGLPAHVVLTLRLVAHDEVPSYPTEELASFCALVGLQGRVGAADELTEHINTVAPSGVEAILVAALAWDEVKFNQYRKNAEETPRITALAAALDLDLESIRKEVQEEMRAEAKADAKDVAKTTDKAADKTTSGAKPASAADTPKPARKPKTSKAEAAASIAAALQAADAGAEVGPGGIAQ